MMDGFLFNIAKTLYQTYSDQLADNCIVFPNRRAGLFFSRYLSEITDKPIWSPTFITINEFIQQLSDLIIDEPLSLIFELYDIYKKETKTNESFDEFYFWGEMLLNDFDDIDKYLVDPADLFQNLASLKAIEDQFNYLTKEQLQAIQNFWKSFNPEKHSKNQDDFIQIWTVLNNIYIKFKEKLHSKGIAYEGMVYREVANKIQNSHEFDFPYKGIFFIGFNALNPCEEKLFSFFKNNKKAQFFWDYDEYYIKNKFHKAGFFIRENIKHYPPATTCLFFNNLTNKEKKVDIIAVPSEVGQAKIVKQFIPEPCKTNNYDYSQTAIVLPDEHLLMPVLHSIPEEINEINVTMGYPLKETPIYSLVEHINELHKNSRITSGNNFQFYYKDVLAILNHQYISNLNTGIIEKLVDYIIKNNRIFISAEELTKCELLKNIFTKISNENEIHEYLLNILYFISERMNSDKEEEKNNKINLDPEYIYHLYISIRRLKEICTEKNIQLNIGTYFKLLKKIIQSLRIPFNGEPLAGIQVMGILETRALDFKNVIVLSMNEGIFPKSGVALSFIPYNLRKGFNLPTVEHQDSIYAYYFYRLIQRANNVTLVYNSKSTNLFSGEMSRFLYQLKYEPEFEVRKKNLTYDINIHSPKKISIKKSFVIINKLNQFISGNPAKKYFSPSAINTYLDCSLKFYFSYIAEIKETEKITEEIDAATFGNLFHKAMKVLYEPFIKKQLIHEEIVKINQDGEAISKAVLKAFKEELNISENEKTPYNLTGRNVIIYDILKKYITQLTEVDKKLIPFTIISLEELFEIHIPVNILEDKKIINLRGKIDRVDKIKEAIRIIDYKTGGAKNSFSGIPALFDRDVKKRNNAVFQTLLYAKLYSENNESSLKILPGLYLTKDLFTKNFDYHIKQTLGKGIYSNLENYSDISDEFDTELKRILTDIFHPTMEFDQVENEEVCSYCPYAAICHRK